jgi:hypothetical protein
VAVASRLDILIPGLFGPVPVQRGDIGDTPTLSRLLGRAVPIPTPGEDPVSALAARFGVSRDQESDWPSGPLCLLGDSQGVPPPNGFIMHADPVHLRVDRDRLLLFDSRHLSLDRREADLLVGLFNAHFSEDGLLLKAPCPDRWYLQLEAAPRMRTTPLHAAVGRSISPLLPQGPEGAAWARILNEAQMLFHQSRVNREREEAGRPSISGIWPWGGGRLSPVACPPRYGLVFGDDPLLAGLAAVAGMRAESLPDDSSTLLHSRPSGDILAVWKALWNPVLDADGAGWLDQLQRLDAWLAPLADALRRGAVGLIDLDPCVGRGFRVSRWGLRRFWRGTARIREYMH